MNGSPNLLCICRILLNFVGRNEKSYPIHMKRQKFYIFMVCAVMSAMLLTFTCCGRDSEVSGKLDRAESLMDDHPDSALMMLEDIPANELRNGKEKALYGLLYTQALDKNWLEPKNDSLISMAVDYYESVDDPYRQAMASYYQGVVRYNNDNYPASIKSFFKANEISESNGFDFYAGMACRGISDIYNESYNTAEELLFAEKEYEHFRKADRQPYINYAHLDYIRALSNKGDFAKVISESKLLQDSARLYEDEPLRHEALRIEAKSHMAQRKYLLAYPKLLEICESCDAMNEDTLKLCQVMLGTGQQDDASKLLKITSNTNPALKKMVEYLMDRKAGNFEEAMLKLEFVDSVTNQEYRKSSSHNLTTSITDYLKVKNSEKELKLKEARIYRNLSIGGTVVAILMIVSMFLHYYRKQSEKISEKVLLAEQLAESLKKSETENAHSSEVLKSLQSSKNELLEELCTIAYQNNDEGNRRRKVADAVDRLIEDLSTESDRIKQWEKEVDSLHDNIFSDFKNDLPKLKDIDYRLFLFMVMRLEMPTITLLLKENKTEAVYNRKRRLKNKIVNLECENRDIYLTFF